MNAPFFGNAGELRTGENGWFLGHFAPHGHPLRREDLEMKWTRHPAGDARPTWAAPDSRSSLSILISGLFVIEFPDSLFRLEKQGDFAFWGPGCAHTWRAEADSLILTVRWPSLG
jgi:hypothetical protein